MAGLPTDRIVVFDAAGRRIHDELLGAGAVDAANWLPGVYHVLRCSGSSCGAARWIRQ